MADEAMMNRREFLSSVAAVPALGQAADPFSPRGRLHIPIGIPDTLDSLKTFVEAEGNFSPGVGTYGIYYWLYDPDDRKVFAPTFDGVTVEHGLGRDAALIPWARWRAGQVNVKSEVCHVERSSAAGRVHVAASRATLKNESAAPKRVVLFVALRPVGAAGWDVNEIAVSPSGDALLVNGHAAVVAAQKPTGAGVADSDTVAGFASRGTVPAGRRARSESGDCSGAMRFDVDLPPASERTIGIICPVLPGRRAVRHKWVDLKQNAMVDAAAPNPLEGGVPQPDPGLDFYRGLSPASLFEDAARHWAAFLARIDIRTPDPRWGESMKAILAHAGMSMNEGAPDVAVVNYNVFNRDGMYIAHIMQKSGLREYSERIIDFFVKHPFNGRAYPEADNPGQVLWAMQQHWLLTRDKAWLQRIYPQAAKIARMIRYYRTTPGPHLVAMDSLDFGEALPAERRQLLEPGRCDGFHPEYTEAFDIAGLRGAAELAEAAGRSSDSREWARLAGELFAAYDARFGERLPRSYGSYSVLWPCRLYPLDRGKGIEQFRNIGGQLPKSWRYFPLATAHQGLLAGNREAGYGTLEAHLGHEQMRHWYAFDEGGGSGSGGWHHLRTTWTHSKEKPGENRAVAMPHGWAIAEHWLLMRDCIAYEDSGRLVLLAGVPPAWFTASEGIHVRRMQTHFGPLDLTYRAASDGAELRLRCRPPAGYLLKLPPELRWTAYSGSERLEKAGGGISIPASAGVVRLRRQA